MNSPNMMAAAGAQRTKKLKFLLLGNLLDLFTHRLEGVPSQGATLGVRAYRIEERQEGYFSCRVGGEKMR
jgi:hypothetical protein